MKLVVHKNHFAAEFCTKIPIALKTASLYLKLWRVLCRVGRIFWQLQMPVWVFEKVIKSSNIARKYRERDPGIRKFWRNSAKNRFKIHFYDLIFKTFEDFLRFFVIEIFNPNFWFKLLIHIFDSNIWFKFLIHIFDSNFWFKFLIQMSDLNLNF